jgi:hypothetical protein
VYLNSKRQKGQIVVILHQFYAECGHTISFVLLKSEPPKRGSLGGVFFVVILPVLLQIVCPNTPSLRLLKVKK